MIGRNDPCWCGSGIKWKKCHFPAEGKTKENQMSLKDQYYKQYQIIIKDQQHRWNKKVMPALFPDPR